MSGGGDGSGGQQTPERVQAVAGQHGPRGTQACFGVNRRGAQDKRWRFAAAEGKGDVRPGAGGQLLVLTPGQGGL